MASQNSLRAHLVNLAILLVLGIVYVGLLTIASVYSYVEALLIRSARTLRDLARPLYAPDRPA